MAISVFMRFHSERDAIMLYESVINEMGRRGGTVAPGELYHIAALAHNGMFVADLWESREAFNAYAQAKLIPLTAKRGLFSPEVEFGDVHNILEGAAFSPRGTGVVAHFEGDVDDLLRKFDKAAGKIGNPNVSNGLVFQWCAKHAGGICITAHWRSREECEPFMNGSFSEALRSAGMPRPRLDIYDVYNCMDGRVHA
jgi:hypothetical protein